MFKPEFSIEGAKEIDAILKQLPYVARKKVVSGAVRSGANIIAKEAKLRCPYNKKRKSGEHLRDEIIVRKKKGSNDIYQVGPSKLAPHGHLVEFGTKIRYFEEPRKVNIGGKWVIVEKTGVMPAQPFLRPAVDTKGNQAINKIGERLGIGIEREAAKLSGKYFDSGLRPKRSKRRR